LQCGYRALGGRDTVKLSSWEQSHSGGRAILVEQPNREMERGGSTVKFILTVLVLGALIFAGVKIIPVYVTNYQFQDSMQTEARFALSGFPRKTEDEVRDDLWKEAQKQGIPARKEDIHVTIEQGVVTITMDYSVPIDLKVYQWAPEFHLHADNHTI
jgi:hypothetical protein